MDNSKLKKIEFKRMLKSYESSLEDLEYLREMASEINSEFNSALAAKQRQDLFESKKLEELAEEETEESESSDRDPLFKKLFRKIVVKCHPDRMDPDLSLKEQANRLEFYEMANQANDEDNMALLIIVAIKLELELENEYIEHVEKIKEENERVRKDIEAIQNSIAWNWYHTEEDNRDAILENYIKHMEKILMQTNKIKKNILGLGHPRTGTGYTHKIMQSWGLNVGHEEMKKDGIIAWQLVHKKGPWPFIDTVKEGDVYSWKTLIYNVRDPKDSIPSIIFTEDVVEESTMFRNKMIGVKFTKNRVESAILSILAFDKIIMKRNPDFIYRIEDQSENLFNFLKEGGHKVLWNSDYINKKYNRRSHKKWESLSDDVNNLKPSLKLKINNYCIKYGYKKLF